MSAVRKILKKILDKRRNNQIFKYEWINANAIKNIRPQKIKNILFVIPPIGKYSGGHTSILRLGRYLSLMGYNVTYAVYENFQRKEQIEAAQSCLPNYLGDIIDLHQIPTGSEFDIIIATNCISVYYAQKLDGYKIIFAQDYEPFFYEAGDYNLFAKKSYELGFHIISLGEWNKKMILKFVDETLQIDTVQFPYEKSEYSYIKRDYMQYKNKKEISLCVYIRQTPRRLPGICQMICKQLKERFAADGVELQVYYFGEDSINYEYGKNLGKLNKVQLSELYSKCDFGMVASYTNISLVPYEMLAMGLPIIEMKDGSFPYFFELDDAFLFDLDYDALYKNIKYAIENPEILVERDKRIQKKLEGLSWEITAREFESILRGIVQE